MRPDQFEDVYGQYIDRFGGPPLEIVGVDDDTLMQLMTDALQTGRPITEEDYDRDVPDSADR